MDRLVRMIATTIVCLIREARGSVVSITLPKVIKYSGDEELKKRHNDGRSPAIIAYKFHHIMNRLKMAGLVEEYTRHHVIYILNREKWGELWRLVKSGEEERAIEYLVRIMEQA